MKSLRSAPLAPGMTISTVGGKRLGHIRRVGRDVILVQLAGGDQRWLLRSLVARANGGGATLSVRSHQLDAFSLDLGPAAQNRSTN